MKLKLWLIVGIIVLSVPIGISIYYANKPPFSFNYIEDNFEDGIPGLFPMGWLSVVNPFNVRVVKDGNNKVMEVKDTDSKEVTEICRRFKKTTIGIIECDIKPLDIETGFVIHIPQTDREYDPYDDIIIVFLKGGIYVIGEENILELGEDSSFWSWLRLTNDQTWLIDEWKLGDYNSVMKYEANLWYSIKIDFNKENFLLTINGNQLRAFNYPKYNPPYFCSLYFWTLITPNDFKFYVDNVKITLSQTVDYIHPMNIFFLSIIPIFIIGFYLLYKRGKRN